jgi:hypothetical protein
MYVFDIEMVDETVVLVTRDKLVYEVFVKS